MLSEAAERVAAFQQQRDFKASRARYSFAAAAVRTGKTFSAADQFADRLAEDYAKIDMATHEGPVTYWVIGPNYHETIAQKLELFCGPVPLIPQCMVDRSIQGNADAYRNPLRGGGSVALIGNRILEFKSAANPQSLVARKVRGVWWTEIARSKYDAWPNVSERLANYDDSWMVADTSPYGHCWFYKELWEPAIQGRLSDVETFTWTALDSPFVSDAQIATAREMLSREHFEADFMASWATFKGQIYGAFKRDVHMLPGCPFVPERYLIGVDVNTVAEKPSSFSLWAVGGQYVDASKVSHSRAHKISEHEEYHGLDYESYAASIARLAKPLHDVAVIIDPSAHRQFKTMLRNHDLTLRDGFNALKPGIANLGAALQYEFKHDKRPLLTISTSCTSTASQFEGYHWTRNAAGVVVEIPDKTSLDPHLLDGDRYVSHEIWRGFRDSRQLR